MNQQYRHSRHSISLINFHFVWIPRRRKKVLVGEVAARLEEVINDVTADLNLNILAMEIMPDHVHLFVSCPPNIAADQIMFRIKGRSSRILRQEFPHLLKMPSMWTRSYFVSTAGNVSTETIKRYIAEQSKD
jgi:putative transposase